MCQVLTPRVQVLPPNGFAALNIMICMSFVPSIFTFRYLVPYEQPGPVRTDSAAVTRTWSITDIRTFSRDCQYRGAEHYLCPWRRCVANANIRQTIHVDICQLAANLPHVCDVEPQAWSKSQEVGVRDLGIPWYNKPETWFSLGRTEQG